MWLLIQRSVCLQVVFRSTDVGDYDSGRDALRCHSFREALQPPEKWSQAPQTCWMPHGDVRPILWAFCINPTEGSNKSICMSIASFTLIKKLRYPLTYVNESVTVCDKGEGTRSVTLHMLGKENTQTFQIIWPNFEVTHKVL